MMMTMRITGMSSPDGKTTGTEEIALTTVHTKNGTETSKMTKKSKSGKICSESQARMKEDHTRVVRVVKAAAAVEEVEEDLLTESLNGKETGMTTGLTTGKMIGIVPPSK